MKYAKCAGCGRNNICLSKFPDDYPRDIMLCCACTWSYYHHLGIAQPSRADCPITSSIYRQKGFLEDWWALHGETIEKAMRIR